MVCFNFAGVNHLSGPLRKQEVPFSQVKRSRLSVVIGTFKTILFVSVFQELLAVTIIVMEGGKTQSSVGI